MKYKRRCVTLHLCVGQARVTVDTTQKAPIVENMPKNHGAANTLSFIKPHTEMYLPATTLHKRQRATI